MAKWRCSVCNYVFEGEAPPDGCPVCEQPREKFVKEEAKDRAKDVAAMKKATRKVQYGLHVIASKDGDKLNGQVANAVMQVTTNPTTFSLAVFKENYTADCILDCGRFTVNILGQDNHKLVRRFGYRSGREFEKFKGIDHDVTESGMPYLTGCVGWFECEVKDGYTIDCDSHWLFVADVVDGDGLRDDVEPMTYAYFRATK